MSLHAAGFRQRWEKVPHRFSVLGTSVDAATACAEANSGADPDVAHFTVTATEAALGASTVLDLGPFVALDQTLGDGCPGGELVFDKVLPTVLPPGARSAALRSFRWESWHGGKRVAVWLDHFEVQLSVVAKAGGPPRLRLLWRLGHADAPDLFKPPPPRGGVEHRLSLSVELFDAPGRRQKLLRAAPLYKGAADVRRTIDAGFPVGAALLGGFGFRIKASGPKSGRYLQDVAFDLTACTPAPGGKVTIAARLGVHALWPVVAAETEAWVHALVLPAPAPGQRRGAHLSFDVGGVVTSPPKACGTLGPL